jgi:ppGpp synthetase/RelA/SpoT-type nucleotidyltranferase
VQALTDSINDVPTAIRQKFADLEDPLTEIANKVSQTVLAYCDREGFAYAGRRKTLESLAEKIETGRYANWSNLDDLFGCCIIIPKLDQESLVLEFLRNAFVEIETKQRGKTRKSPDEFRFDATRFVGRLRAVNPANVESYLYSTLFEIQIRSAFEHAWSVTTHAIYKGGSIDWKAKRLVAQLKAAVEQLDSLVRASSDPGPIVEHDWPELTSQRQIVERFSGFVSAKRIPAELAPKDWSRFAENLYSLIRAGRKDPRIRPEMVVREVLEIIDRSLPSDPRSMPHSVSLLQFAFGELVTLNYLANPLDRFSPLVTRELLDFYPKVSSYQAACFAIDG